MKHLSLVEKYKQWREIADHFEPELLATVYKKYTTLFQGAAVPITWMPNKETIADSNMYRAMQTLHLESYKDFFDWAEKNRAAFWEIAVKTLGIKFKEPYANVLDSSKNLEDPVWFEGAKINIVDSCFLAPKDKTAIVEGSEETPETRKISYGELEEKTNAFAAGLLKKGLASGDRVVFYAPFSIEATIAFLSCIKAGIIPVSVADSFSSEELVKRAGLTQAKLVIAGDGYFYGGKWLNGYAKVKESPIPAIVIRRNAKTELREGDLLFETVLSSASPSSQSYCSDPQGISAILFSSGTTKEPKVIPWTHITPIKAASDGYFHLNIKETDIVTWTTGMGWMMAPWLIYASFINKATMALFVGAATGTPFGKFVEDEQISILGTIPSVVKAWKVNEFHKKFNWKVKLYSSTGEPSNAEDYFYLMALSRFQAPIIEYCGGTEIGGGYITGSVLQPASPGTFTTPALGLNFYLLKDQKPVEANRPGEVYIVPPSVGLTQTLLNKNHHDEYYAGTPKGPHDELLRRHGDTFEKIQEEGFIFYKSGGRSDDAMNLGGIKVSAVEIEEIINADESVLESAAVSMPGEGGGPERLLLFIVPRKDIPDEIGFKKALQQLITEKLNPLFRVSDIRFLEKLPRTASNKVMRRELRKGLISE